MGKNKPTVSYIGVPQRRFTTADSYFVPDTGYGHFNCIILSLMTISLALKVKFLGGSQSLCWIPGLENLLCTLGLSQQCENFFGISSIRGSSAVCGSALWWGWWQPPPKGLCHMLHLPGLLQPEPLSLGQATATLPLQETPKHSKADLAQSLMGVSTPFPGSQGAQAFVYALPASLVSMKFESKHNFAFPIIFNNLLMVVLQLAAILVSLQKMSTHPSTHHLSRNLILKASGNWLQNSHRTGETDFWRAQESVSEVWRKRGSTVACCCIRSTDSNSPGKQDHSVASGQITGSEHSPTHQQKMD